LLEHFKLNIETNHATLALHTMRHELTVAANAGALGSIDANRGDELVGWDTDQFPTDLHLAAEIMLVVLGMGGFTTGGLNFDAKRGGNRTSRRICFTRTSAGWTRLRAGCGRRRRSARTGG